MFTKLSGQIRAACLDRKLANSIVFCICGTLALSWVAIWNGYPLVFSDSGTYIRSAIQHVNPGDRPIYYSLFIELFHLRISLWPVVFAQGLITVWIIDRVIDTLSPLSPSWMRIGVLVFFSICTGLPWSTGEIMPDFFAPLLIVAVYLIVVESERLRYRDCLLLLAFLITAEASHFSHVALAIGTLCVIGILSFLMRRRISCRGFVLSGAATVAAVAAILAINYAERKELVFAPWGSVLLLAKLAEYGTAQDYLSKTCPTHTYRICKYRDELPRTVGTFLYGDGTALDKLGGPEGYRDEAGPLAINILKDAPIRHALLAAKATASMFVYFPTGWGNDPEGEDKAVTQMIHRYFRREADGYDMSRQQTGQLHRSLVNDLHVPVGFFLLAANLAFLMASIIRGNKETTFLLLAILAAMIGNAFLCGALSSSDGRYQSRMIPLLVIGLLPLLQGLTRPG
jgi:hypothetical protein